MPGIRKIPWWTEGSIKRVDEFLSRLPQAKVLEFGCGASTIWLSKRPLELVSIDHDPEWYNKIKPLVGNVDIRLVNRPYDHVCSEFPDEFFDMIVIDGRDRVLCAQSAGRILKTNGLLVLDNSERKEYTPIFDMFSSWAKSDYEQKGPDSEGFWNPGWLTTVWIKPNILQK